MKRIEIADGSLSAAIKKLEPMNHASTSPELTDSGVSPGLKFVVGLGM